MYLVFILYSNPNFRTRVPKAKTRQKIPAFFFRFLLRINLSFAALRAIVRESSQKLAGKQQIKNTDDFASDVSFVTF